MLHFLKTPEKCQDKVNKFNVGEHDLIQCNEMYISLPLVHTKLMHSQQDCKTLTTIVTWSN